MQRTSTHPAASRRTHAKPLVVGVVCEEHAKDAHTPVVDSGYDTIHVLMRIYRTQYILRKHRGGGDTLQSSYWGKHNRCLPLYILYLRNTKTAVDWKNRHHSERPRKNNSKLLYDVKTCSKQRPKGKAINSMILVRCCRWCWCCVGSCCLIVVVADTANMYNTYDHSNTLS